LAQALRAERLSLGLREMAWEGIEALDGDTFKRDAVDGQAA
jgi:hypothetical protein